MILQLLEIGIPYDEIFKLDEDEVKYLLAVHTAIAEKRNQHNG